VKICPTVIEILTFNGLRSLPFPVACFLAYGP